MSTAKQLRTRTDTVINFTNRIDVKPAQVLFEVSPQGNRMRYRITLRNWPSLVSRVTPRHNLTLQFDRGGEPAQRVNHDSAERFIRGGGVIAGEIDGGFDPASLSVRVIISDPARGHAISVSAIKGRPDVDDADLSGHQETPPVNIAVLRDAPGKDDGAINIYESADVSGAWDLRLLNVECPHLVVSPLIGKQAMVSDPRVQFLVMPEVFRRIVRELALHPDLYESEPWTRHWRSFAASLSGIGEWSFFAGEDEEIDIRALDARIADAVIRFQETYLKPVAAPVRAGNDDEE